MKSSKIKKFFIYSFASLSICTLLSFIYIFYPKLPDSIDNRFRDYLFNIRGEIPNSNSVVIVDIDEKSLKTLGQWPWSRNKLSLLLETLSAYEVGIIGFDIVFPENDNSSPHKVLKDLNIQSENAPDYDMIFAKTIATTPTILGYQFELEDEKHLNSATPKIPAIFIEKSKNLESNYLINAYGTILNIPKLQENSYSSGFFNNIPDNSGIIRSVPLVISYDDTIYPSLSLELMRIITQTQKVYINYDDQGVQNIVLNDIAIPTDRHGRLLINFRGKEKNFKYYSAIDVIEQKIDKEDLEGKIVLIGTSAAGLLDLRATPFESVYPGVEVHANAIDNMIEGDFIYKASWVDGANIMAIFVLSFLTVFLITYVPFWVNPIIVITLLSSTIYGIYYMLFTQGVVLNIFFPISTIFLAIIVSIMLNYFFKIKQEEAIKKKFASKVSKEVMEDLLKNMDNSKFQAMEKEITVFFSDVRGFTQISESMPSAKELITYLNEYMEPMSNIINKYHGTIDKYIGDAIMAYWNAPCDVENHADKAVKASLEQIKYLDILNKKLQKENKPIIDIGIGLNSGMAVVGEMGSIGRSDYTVIGDSINLGARLESLCKYYGSKLNISNFTKKRLTKDYTFRFLDLVTVKGKSEPIEIWQVIDDKEPTKEIKEELERYHEAIKLYKESQFEKALTIFESIENSQYKTNDKIYKIYIQRCKEYIENPPKDFNGVYEHLTKG